MTRGAAARDVLPQAPSSSRFSRLRRNGQPGTPPPLEPRSSLPAQRLVEEVGDPTPPHEPAPAPAPAPPPEPPAPASPSPPDLLLERQNQELRRQLAAAHAAVAATEHDAVEQIAAALQARDDQQAALLDELRRMRERVASAEATTGAYLLRAEQAEEQLVQTCGAVSEVERSRDAVQHELAAAVREHERREQQTAAQIDLLTASREEMTLQLTTAQKDAAVLAALVEEADQTVLEQAQRIRDLEEELESLRWTLELTGSRGTPAPGREPLVETDRAEPWAPPATDITTGLYTWQTEALHAWTEAGCHGVIEAVTGAGKTRVGIAAARMALQSGRKTLVLAPTIELIHQWKRSFHEAAPELSVGLQGDGERDDLRDHDVLISTIAGAVNTAQLPTYGGLLLADEAHTLGTPNFSYALDEDADWRLGLTATYDRGDDGNEDYLDPYFSGVCYRLWYDRALADRVIAPFTVSLVGVRLETGEQEAYEKVDDKVKRAMTELVRHWDVPAQPFGEFMREVTRLTKSGDGRASNVARSYVKNFNRRREILAESHVKLHVLSELAPIAAEAERALVFTQTQETARQAADLLSTCGVDALPLYSDMERSTRKETMSAFAAGRAQLLAAPRLLDQGIDVPEADFGIILSASKSRRQMVQRLGRVVRRKADGRCGRLVVVYAENTVEDPAAGDGSNTLTEILEHAERVDRFRVPADLERLSAFLQRRYPG